MIKPPSKASLKRSYTRVIGCDCTGYATFVQVGVQSFCVCDYTNKKRAEWFRDRVTTALYNLSKELLTPKERSPKYRTKESPKRRTS